MRDCSCKRCLCLCTLHLFAAEESHVLMEPGFLAPDQPLPFSSSVTRCRSKASVMSTLLAVERKKTKNKKKIEKRRLLSTRANKETALSPTRPPPPLISLSLISFCRGSGTNPGWRPPALRTQPEVEGKIKPSSRWRRSSDGAIREPFAVGSEFGTCFPISFTFGYCVYVPITLDNC